MSYDTLAEAVNDHSVMGKKMRCRRLAVPVTRQELGDYFKELGKAVPRLPFLPEFSGRFGVQLEDLATNPLPL